MLRGIVPLLKCKQSTLQLLQLFFPLKVYLPDAPNRLMQCLAVMPFVGFFNQNS